MKKSLLMAALLSGFVSAYAAYDVPYTSILTENGAMSSEWITVDTSGNGADYNNQRVDEWAYPTGATYAGYFNDEYPAGVILYENQLNVTDPDLLISPAISLEGGKEYRVRYAVRTKWAASTTFNPAGSLYLVAEDDVTGSNPVLTIDTFESQGNTAWTNYGFVFTAPATGAYRVVYGITIRYKSAYCCFTNFQVVENRFVPAAPSGVTAVAGTAADPRALSVTLSWTNPTTDADGLPMTDANKLDKVLIYRDADETPVAVITDGSTTWTDSGATGLVPGFHTYRLEAIVDGVASAFTSVKTAYVGPVVAFDLPVTISTAGKDDFNLLWSYDNNGITSAYGWQYNTSQNLAYCSYSQVSGDGNNCWLFTPKMNFDKVGVYRIVLNAGTTLVDGQSVTLAYGAVATPAGMTEIISDDVALSMSTWTGSDTDPVEFTVTAPGEYYIGIKTQTESDRGLNYFVKTVQVGRPTEMPTFDPESGEVAKGTLVTIATSTPDAAVYYTVDGTDPTEKSLLYTTPIAVEADMTLKAIAVGEGCLASEVATAEYTVSSVPVAVEEISASADETPVYYNLQGIRVSNPVKGTVYVVRRGQTVSKEIR